MSEERKFSNKFVMAGIYYMRHIEMSQNLNNLK